MIIRSKTMIGDVELNAVLHVRGLGEPAETEDEFRQRVGAARYPWPRHGTIACPCIFCGDPDRLARERSELLGLLRARAIAAGFPPAGDVGVDWPTLALQHRFCPTCSGAGQKPVGEPCVSCNGRGRVRGG